MVKQLVVVLLASAFSCRQQPPAPPSEADVSRQLEQHNRDQVAAERLDIETHLAMQSLSFQSTSTGLRYHIFSEGNGPFAAAGNEVTVGYRIQSLSGQTFYSSAADGPKSFRIGASVVESGLHEGLQLMRAGDSAVFILPSHLAHGVSGDQQKIPPRTPLKCFVNLQSIQ